jgi:cell division protein FtsZ
MAIMTGVQSAQVLGPTAQKQADKSRQAIDGETFDAADNVQGDTDFGTPDGGRDDVQTDDGHGLDVIRTE